MRGGRKLDALYRALGVDAFGRERPQTALLDLVPVKGVPVIESTAGPPPPAAHPLEMMRGTPP